MFKSRKENPQKLTQLSSRSHPRHLVGKRTAQKDITIDTTRDSQVNSNFPNRWSPASQVTYMVRKLEKLVDNYTPKTYPLSYIGDICL